MKLEWNGTETTVTLEDLHRICVEIARYDLTFTEDERKAAPAAVKTLSAMDCLQYMENAGETFTAWIPLIGLTCNEARERFETVDDLAETVADDLNLENIDDLVYFTPNNGILKQFEVSVMDWRWRRCTNA